MVVGQSLALRDVTFADLYLMRDRNPFAWVRGLRGYATGNDAAFSGVPPLPPDLLQDAAVLYDRVETAYQADPHHREFTLTHQGVTYRCSGMDLEQMNPEAARPHRLNWCLRRVMQSVPRIEQLGLSPAYVERLETARKQRGLVLVSGPFGCGKTTLACATFQSWVRRDKEMAVTFEDPPELDFAHDNSTEGLIRQIDISRHSLASSFRLMRRWAPRFLFFGELRDAPAAKEVIQMSISGITTLTTIHAADPVQAIVGLFRYASENMSEEVARNIIASGLISVFHIERHAGRSVLQCVDIQGKENHLIRGFIRLGNFQGLYEVFDRQKAVAGRP